MKYRILRIIVLLVLLINISSCGMGRWRRYNSRDYYGSRRHYHSYHANRNRDW